MTNGMEHRMIEAKLIAGVIEELLKISDGFLVNRIHAKCAECKIEVSEETKVLDTSEMVLIRNNEYEKLRQLLRDKPLKGIFAIHVIDYHFHMVFFFRKVTPVAAVRINSGIASDYGGVYTEYVLGTTKKIYNKKEYEIMEPFLTRGEHCRENDIFDFLRSIGMHDRTYSRESCTLDLPDITQIDERLIAEKIVNMVIELRNV